MRSDSMEFAPPNFRGTRRHRCSSLRRYRDSLASVIAVSDRADLERFLARPLTAHLATVGPHVRPVWFLWEAGAFWVISGPWSTVCAEIERDRSVALAVDVADVHSGETKQVVALGEAELRPWDEERAGRLLTRYLGSNVAEWDARFPTYLRGDGGCVWVRIVPTRRPRLVDLSFTPCPV